MSAEYHLPIARSTPESAARWHRVFADKPIWRPTMRERVAGLFNRRSDAR